MPKKFPWKQERDEKQKSISETIIPFWPLECGYHFLPSYRKRRSSCARSLGSRNPLSFKVCEWLHCLFPNFPFEITKLVQSYLLESYKPRTILHMVEKWQGGFRSKYLEIRNIVSCRTHGFTYLVRHTFPNHRFACSRGHHSVPRFTQYAWCGKNPFLCLPLDFLEGEKQVLVWRFGTTTREGAWTPLNVQVSVFDPLLNYGIRDPKCDECREYQNL